MSTLGVVAVVYFAVAVVFGVVSFFRYPWATSRDRWGAVPQAVVWPLGVVAWVMLTHQDRSAR